MNGITLAQQPLTAVISGQVSDTNGRPVAGVTLLLNGTAVNSGTTDGFGKYSFTVDLGGDYSITPSSASYVFDPKNRSLFNVQGNQIADFTSAPATQTPTVAFRDALGSIRLSTYGSSALSDSGGLFAADPSTAQDRYGDTYVIARDGYDSIWLNIYRPSTSWSGWNALGGILQGSPGIALSPSDNGHIWIAARDAAGSYWLLDLNSANTWAPLPGVFSTDPVIAACADGSVYLIGKDNSNALWSAQYKPFPYDGFQGWQFGGGVIQGKPAATCGGDNAVYVVAEDNSNSNWMARVVGNTWTGWFYGGASTTLTPRIAALGNGSEAVVILDSTGVVWTTTFTEGTGNGWQPWVQVGGILRDVAIEAVSGELFLTGTDANGDLWWWRQTGNQWTWIASNGVAVGALDGNPR